MKALFRIILSLVAMPLPFGFAQADELARANSDEVGILREPPLPPQPHPPRDRPLPPPQRPPPYEPPPRRPPPYEPPPHRPPPYQPPPHRPPPYEPPPHRPPPWRPPPPQPIEEARTVYLNQYFSETTLDLDLMFELRRWYWGYSIDRFEVRSNDSGQYDQELTLLINGFIEDRIRPGYFSPLYVRGYKSVGRDIDRVEMYVNGTVYIDSITVYLRRN